MPEASYPALVWLSYRLAMTFGIAIPFILFLWAAIKKEGSILKLLTIYWKVTSLIGISLLLLTEHRTIGYISFFTAPVLMFISVWFWLDLNEELEDLPLWRALPLTVKIWRYSLSFYALLTTSISILSISCLNSSRVASCNTWLDFPNKMHQITESLFGFLFGASWTQPLAAFFGYVLLIAYLVGLIQWLLIKFPKQGRIAGGF